MPCVVAHESLTIGIPFPNCRVILCWMKGCAPIFWLFPTTGTCSGHVLQTLCLFLGILDITDLFWTFSFWTPVWLDWLCLLWVA
jgi:hypothetical protein